MMKLMQAARRMDPNGNDVYSTLDAKTPRPDSKVRLGLDSKVRF